MAALPFRYCTHIPSCLLFLSEYLPACYFYQNDQFQVSREGSNNLAMKTPVINVINGIKNSFINIQSSIYMALARAGRPSFSPVARVCAEVVFR